MRRCGGRARGGGIKGGLKACLQAFPNLRLFSRSFSKESFGRFLGFQRVARAAANKICFQIFSSLAPLSGRISDAVAPASARARRIASSALSRRAAAFAVHEIRVHGDRVIHRENFSTWHRFCFVESHIRLPSKITQLSDSKSSA
jgi:hypothetical protein